MDDMIGPTDTDMIAMIPAETRAIINKSMPSGRIGTIFDIGDAVALLVSESARWISGQAIFVANGVKG
jgi:3-oxoacyl-[acyl-carrier protein] reductase